MKKRLLINIATAICGVIAAAAALLYALPSSRAVTCSWSVSSTRYDVIVERGSLLVRQLHDYRFNTPFRWGFYEPETPKQFVGFTELTAWWHGDNSWWERVGYTVNDRQRHFGFEYASGKYWPPFFWQHPKIPFDVYQVPLWAVVVFFMLLPLLRVFNKVMAGIRSTRSAKITATESAAK